MPTYDYSCATCGRVFEYVQSIESDALTQCPESVCQAEQKGQGVVTRIITRPAGIIFNGSGFYLTDYTGYGKSSSATTSASSDGSGTASAATSNAPTSSESSSSAAPSTSSATT